MTRARSRSILAIVVGALAWAAITACNQNTVPTPIRSFDRPTDVALVCAQYDPNITGGSFRLLSLSSCEPTQAQSPDKLDFGTPKGFTEPPGFVPAIGPAAQPFAPFLMALVTQSARGELALVDTAQEKLLDADPRKPGFGFVPVGKLPEHVRASADGRMAVTTNTDSCDLAVVDVSQVIGNSLVQLFPQDAGVASTADLASGVVRKGIAVNTGLKNADGTPVLRELQSRPTWIEMAPEDKDGAHKAWVALPACQLVVKVGLDFTNSPDALVESAIRVTKTGTELLSTTTDLQGLDCPAECAGDAIPAAGADLAIAPPTDMGPADNLPSTQAFPGTLAIDIERSFGVPVASRLVIADLYGERIDIIPLDPTSGAPAVARTVQLESGAGGVRVVRVSPRSQAGKFIYAIARDGTVRVVDLDRETECETNPDPRFAGGGIDLQQTPTSPSTSPSPLPATLPAPTVRSLGCFPLNDPNRPPRSALATSPGITLTPGELPTDIAFIHVTAPPFDPNAVGAPPAASPGVLAGDFAWIIASDGRGILVNIFDDCPQPNQQVVGATSGFKPACDPQNAMHSNDDTRSQFGHPEAMLLDRVSHRLRGGHARFAQPTTESDTSGMARVTNHLTPCAVAVPPTAPLPMPGTGPDLAVPDLGMAAPPDMAAPVGACNSSPILPSLVRDLVPDRLADPKLMETRVVSFVDPDRVRNETWALTWEGVLIGTDRPLGAPTVDGITGVLSDSGGAWCSRGVKRGDKLRFKGCTVDSECNQAGHFQCVHDPTAFPDVSQGMCLPVDSEHTVESYSGNGPKSCGLLLRSQRKYRITSATVANGKGRTTDVLKLAEIYEPEFDVEATDCTTPNVACAAPLQIGDRQLPTTCLPDWDGQNRCLVTCKDDTDCGPDFECAQSQLGDLRCMRAPIEAELWKRCMPELQEYEIHVGDAFTVAGTASGMATDLIANKDTGECEIPAESSEFVRLRQWRIPLEAPACMSKDPLDSMPAATSTSNVCKIEPASSSVRQIHFENPTFNIAVQIPKNGDKPIVPPDGTTISMALTGGGGALTALLGVEFQAQQPRYAVVAPDGQTVYIVDEGKNNIASGLRGQLLRLFSSTQTIDTTFKVR